MKHILFSILGFLIPSSSIIKKNENHALVRASQDFCREIYNLNKAASELLKTTSDIKLIREEQCGKLEYKKTP